MFSPCKIAILGCALSVIFAGCNNAIPKIDKERQGQLRQVKTSTHMNLASAGTGGDKVAVSGAGGSAIKVKFTIGYAQNGKSVQSGSMIKVSDSSAGVLNEQ